MPPPRVPWEVSLPHPSDILMAQRGGESGLIAEQPSPGRQHVLHSMGDKVYWAAPLLSSSRSNSQPEVWQANTWGSEATPLSPSPDISADSFLELLIHFTNIYMSIRYSVWFRGKREKKKRSPHALYWRLQRGGKQSEPKSQLSYLIEMWP